jgi:D-beta-D-heptose 7-phosphate kinase/D-beta-D-heptose 1-phosphate adenosyltransferase
LILKAFDNRFFIELVAIRKKKIIFFNGCFDLVHLGHVKMIKQMRKMANRDGYTLVCGLNSDQSVDKQNKSHPLINGEDDRADLLKELGVDIVIIFDEETPKELLMYLVPDVVFKGSDYYFKDYPEKEFLSAIKCRIINFETINGYSTTEIYNTIAEYVKEDIRKKVFEC